MYIVSTKDWNCPYAYGLYKQYRGWTHNGRVAATCILICVIEGTCRIKINQKEHFLREKDYIVIPSGHFYTPFADEYCHYYYFHFNCKWLATVPPNMPPVPDIPIDSPIKECFILREQGSVSAPMEDALQKIIQAKNSLYPSAQNTVNLEFFKLLDLISEKNALKEESTTARKIRQYILDHTEEAIPLSVFSAKFGYSKQHIVRLFKKAYGITPTRFITQCRLETSLNYLMETSMSIAEISQKCGFENPNYYIRIFRKKYFTTPQKYRGSIFHS
ncbi:MAG: helix-turn-helix transcriptional regulator [Clostridia bacterium]|nr:helix-turn-helix transcriptional regulator [Clostridia bacterium]MBR2908596.1 helix-turn-helix transcriptional regulator [Clostridia bacterium]